MTPSPAMQDAPVVTAVLARWQSLLATVVDILGASGGVLRRTTDGAQPQVLCSAGNGAILQRGEVSVPLLWPDGRAFGSLVILDDAPKVYGRAQLRLIEETARTINDTLAHVAADAARKAKDAAAEIERDRLALAASMGRAGVWDYNMDADSLYCDPRWYEIMGRDPSNIVTSVDDFRPHIHPEDVERVIEGRIETLTGLTARQEDQDIVFRILRPDGEIRWLTSAACLVRATDTTPNRLVGYVLDITERHHAEDLLHQSLTSLRHAESLAKIGSWTLNVKTGAFCCSTQLQEMIGARPSDPPLTPGDLPRLFTPDCFEEVRAAIHRCISTGTPYQLDTEHLRLDGSGFIAHIRGEALYDTADKIIGMSGTVQDITEREDARRKLELQGRLLEKSAADLARARDAAVEASHAKSAFLANMSHELRTPLNAIIGFSEMMTTAQLGPIPDRYKEYAHDICESGLHLLELINQILDLSKIEAGRMELHEIALSPFDVLESCVRLLRARAEKAGVRLSMRIPSNVAHLWADDLKFRQIVINLLANAIKFTPAGGQISICADFEPRGFLIEVQDTGMGMRPADIPAALEPFRQVGEDTSVKQQGTGLGLPLAKALAELHGGSLSLESHLRQGTTVTVLFPVSRVILPRASAGDAA